MKCGLFLGRVVVAEQFEQSMHGNSSKKSAALQSSVGLSSIGGHTGIGILGGICAAFALFISFIMAGIAISIPRTRAEIKVTIANRVYELVIYLKACFAPANARPNSPRVPGPGTGGGFRSVMPGPPAAAGNAAAARALLVRARAAAARARAACAAAACAIAVVTLKILVSMLIGWWGGA